MARINFSLFFFFFKLDTTISISGKFVASEWKLKGGGAFRWNAKKITKKAREYAKNITRRNDFVTIKIRFSSDSASFHSISFVNATCNIDYLPRNFFASR